MIEVKKVSMLTGKVNIMELDTTQEKLDLFFGSREERPLIQELFPELSVDEREFLLSGATPEEWGPMTMPVEEDEEEHPLAWIDKYIRDKT